MDREIHNTVQDSVNKAIPKKKKYKKAKWLSEESLNCGAGEDSSWQSLGQQGDQTSPS